MHIDVSVIALLCFKFSVQMLLIKGLTCCICNVVNVSYMMFHSFRCHVSHVADMMFYLIHEIITMLMLKVLCEFKNVNLLKYLKLCKNEIYNFKCAFSYGVKVC
jgi:hypothetical protein